GGGLERGVIEGRARREFGIHRLVDEFGEEMWLAHAVDVEAELEEFAGKGAQLSDSLLLPMAFYRESFFDRVGGVADPVLRQAGALALAVEPDAEGVSQQVPRLDGHLRRGGVAAFMRGKEFEHTAGVIGGRRGIIEHLK